MAIIKLNHYSSIKVSGKDAANFLQGQLTCDVFNLPETQVQFGAHCNRQGRIISFFVLFAYADDFYLWMPENVIETAQAALQKYAVFSKVELSLCPITAYGVDQETLDGEFDNTQTVILDYPGDARKLLFDFTNELQLTAQDNNTWHQQNIENLIPKLHPQTIGEFLPHHVNLIPLGAVSFNKGCYTGQEIIARMQHRAKVKKELSVVNMEQACLPGEKTECGECVDGLVIEGGKFLALVIAKSCA